MERKNDAIFEWSTVKTQVRTASFPRFTFKEAPLSSAKMTPCPRVVTKRYSRGTAPSTMWQLSYAVCGIFGIYVTYDFRKKKHFLPIVSCRALINHEHLNYAFVKTSSESWRVILRVARLSTIHATRPFCFTCNEECTSFFKYVFRKMLTVTVRVAKQVFSELN